MNPKLLRLVSLIALVSFVQLACYNSYRITTSELEKLQTSAADEVVYVQGTRGSTTSDVLVSTASPIEVRTTDGESLRLSPFNFTMNEQQLVAPDYDLLLPRDAVAEARVSEFATGKTVALISGIVLAAVGSFVLLTVLADDEEQ